MRIKFVKLTSYIGLYNGMGLEEIFVDFTRCRNKITVIKGKNGCGKSTFFNALHPLPDTNDKFIPGRYAEKHISIMDNDVEYEILIKHPMKDNGNRDTTKAYIDKITGCNRESLNPNGNVSSFKEIIFSELSLDPNFVALTQLSSEDRGLVDKTPSERKKFVTSIIDCLEVYNNIHKTLTKRASVFRSMMNSLVTKIDNIGDKEKLKLTLVSLENRLNNLMTEKDKLVEQLALDKSKIQILDPDGSIQNLYNNIYEELIKINEEISNMDIKINNSFKKLNLSENVSMDEILKIYNDTKNICSELEIEVGKKEGQIFALLSSRENEAKELQNKTAKMATYDIGNIDIEAEIQRCRDSINMYKNIIAEIGITQDISRDEFIMGLNTVKDIKDSIDAFKSSMDLGVAEKAKMYVINGTYPTDIITQLDSELINLKNSIDNNSIELEKYKMKREIASKLSMRPSGCKIDDCSFIKDALDASLLEPDRRINELETAKYNTQMKIEECTKNRRDYDKIIECINYLNSLCRNIEKSSLILNKLPISNLFTNKQTVIDMILNGYSFDEMNKLYSYIDHANILDEYKLEIEKYNKLQSDFEVYKSKNDSVKEIINDIENLNSKINEITTKIESNNKSISEDKIKISNFKSIITELDVLIGFINNKSTLESTKFDLASKFNTIKKSISDIKVCINNIEANEAKVKTIESQITPIINDRDKIKHGLVTLDEYEYELALYTNKYKKVEYLKNESSPSKGIQVIFMELYMNKTTTLANELLQLMFNKEFVLGKFIINDKEFRIPCVGNGLPNDDISSMSTSQRCMISMIISFVMLQQSSTKYNLLKLDEIDGGLDTMNRLQFLVVLDKLMELLFVEQCIMISHNSEMDLSNCDIIEFKLNEGEEINEGNVIWKY